MGVITTKKSLVQLEKLSTASFCRRRLAVVMVRLKMSETLREAATFIEQVCCPACQVSFACGPCLRAYPTLPAYKEKPDTTCSLVPRQSASRFHIIPRLR